MKKFLVLCLILFLFSLISLNAEENKDFFKMFLNQDIRVFCSTGTSFVIYEGKLISVGDKGIIVDYVVKKDGKGKVFLSFEYIVYLNMPDKK